jgi:hypothetical protein
MSELTNKVSPLKQYQEFAKAYKEDYRAHHGVKSVPDKHIKEAYKLRKLHADYGNFKKEHKFPELMGEDEVKQMKEMRSAKIAKNREKRVAKKDEKVERVEEKVEKIEESSDSDEKHNDRVDKLLVAVRGLRREKKQ